MQFFSSDYRGKKKQKAECHCNQKDTRRLNLRRLIMGSKWILIFYSKSNADCNSDLWSSG